MNNRQANGRRRGRGGQRPQGGSSNQGNGSRIDNRARGNAAQLLEKYRNLARDAQMQGDRVNAEYYLQFADHYFRVLSENRSRFEENNPQPRPRPAGDEDDFDYEAEGARSDEPRGNEARNDRDDRPQRQDRGNDQRGNGNGNGNSYANNQPANGYHAEADEVEQRDEPEARREPDQGEPRRRGRPRRDAAPREPQVEESHGIDAAILPPALTVETAPAEDGSEEKPRRRGRRPRGEAEVPAV